MKRKNAGKISTCTMMFSAALVPTIMACSSSDIKVTSDGDNIVELRSYIVGGGKARVSIRLNATMSSAALERARTDIAGRLRHSDSEVVYNFKTGPGMSIIVASEEDLAVLADSPEVERFDVASALHSMLDESGPIVGATDVHNFGYTGAGRTVAVIDSGIEADHDDLENSLVDEACYCTTPIIEIPPNPPEGGEPCCPNGTLHQFGPGAAEEVHPDAHGTHVSGTITGDGTISPRGIAPDADIVAVRVQGGTIDDTTFALEWLLFQHPEIDAVNISRGTFPRYGDGCESARADFENVSDAITALRSAGILTIVASGNSGDTQWLSAPACITNAVAVGATGKDDVVTDYSNSGQKIDLWAPGGGDDCSSPGLEPDCIFATGFDDGTIGLSGTSMAAPHVTAAIALLREADEDLSAAEILECLTTSGPQITDSKNQVTRRRLDIPAALAACGHPLCNANLYAAQQMYQSTGEPVVDGWNIWDNGYSSITHDFDPGPASLAVRVRGESAAGIAPHMVVRVGGVIIGDLFVHSTSWTEYDFSFEATGGPEEIRVEFDNDYYNPPYEDRNLFLSSVSVDCAEEVARPCTGLCEDPEIMSWNVDFHGNNLGTDALCIETMTPLHGGNCGNFAAGRNMFINGTSMTCNGVDWTSVPAARNGGYCFEVTPGDYPWAFMTLW